MDLQALTPDLRKDIEVLAGPAMLEAISEIERNWLPVYKEAFPLKKEPRTRKLAVFPDKEGKTRIIGILDYFSQNALAPLHDFLMEIIKRIPQDCTYDHNKFLALSKSWDWYGCADLSAATDRWPIEAISEMLLGILPEHYVNAWKSIMSKYPFHYKGLELTYATGNPMGALSS
jgi:hypothetical protein